MKAHILVSVALPLIFQGAVYAQTQAKPICSFVPDRVKQPAQAEYVASLRSEEWKNYVVRLEKELDNKVKVMSTALVGAETAKKTVLGFIILNSGKLAEIRVSESSGNPIFDSICVAAVASLEGRPLLKFPEKPFLRALPESISLTPSKSEGTVRQILSEKEIRKVMNLSVEEMQKMLNLPPNELHKNLDAISD
ncbi:MAG TPA: energy transducer TonB [Candidatus Obscuribacter sp.]|nr:energy transducer TonB [Candidatus Obscuribacter sp.]